MNTEPNESASEAIAAAPVAPLVVACGALVKEIRVVMGQLGFAYEPVYLPAPLHNRPDQIVGAIDAAVRTRRKPGQQVIVGYGDCGTGGKLDAWCDANDALRLPGDHCYEFFSGTAAFEALVEEELGTFFLTDFLARNVETLVFGGLKLTQHPELIDAFFGNYRRLVYLEQQAETGLRETAEHAANRLGLAFEVVPTGMAPFRSAMKPLFSETAVGIGGAEVGCACGGSGC